MATKRVEDNRARHTLGRRWRLVILGLATALVPLLPSVATAAVPSHVYLDQAGSSEAVRPSSLRLGEYHSADLHTLANAAVSGISWSSWGGAAAEGTGQALIQWTDAATGLHAQERATVPVLVSASGLQTCGGISVYTSLVISPAPGAVAPPHFAQVAHDMNVMPCAVHAASYVAGKEERHNPNGCFFQGMSYLMLVPPFSLYYCAMHWKTWGAPTTVGIGVARVGYKQYGIRVKLTRIQWCTKWTISYTRETAEIWGGGEGITGMGNVSGSSASRLRALIGRPGQPHKTVHESVPGGSGCVG
jgi:hypothetical protein